MTRGQIALDESGLVGRVTELGARSARVLLITDMNSRIPVTLENSRARAILVGTNGPRPRLMYWPEGVMPAEGERVVTSAEAGAFPAGLPVGHRPLQRQQRRPRSSRPRGSTGSRWCASSTTACAASSRRRVARARPDKPALLGRR